MTYHYPLAVSQLGEEECSSVEAVLRSGKTTMGENVEAFEEAFARYVGMPYAVMVNSGSSADLLCAWVADLGRTGAEVVIPAVTWPTHVWAWEQSGPMVKFCDVENGGVNTTAALIEPHLTNKTRALSLPHLMGIPVDIGPVLKLLQQTGWILHEDCCEALGARYRGGHGKPVGTAADLASWSFFFSHQLSTMEGGMVTTPDKAYDRKLRSLRSHGWNRHYSKDKYTFTGPGFNLRPTEVAAAIGLVQLRKLDAMNATRTANFREFERLLRHHPAVTLPEVPDTVTPSWFGVPMFVNPGRDSLAKYLEERGVETRPILAGNLRSQPGFRGFYFGKTPGADRVQDEGLYVGLHATEDSGAAEVATLIREWA